MAGPVIPATTQQEHGQFPDWPPPNLPVARLQRPAKARGANKRRAVGVDVFKRLPIAALVGPNKFAVPRSLRTRKRRKTPVSPTMQQTSGFGRNGKQSMIKLQNYKKDFVIIEKSDEVINEIDLDGFLNVKGDATTDEALLKAGIETADNLITALPSDADNLFVVLSARQLNTNCRIISRASNESSYSKLKIAGANNVIMPDKLGGDHMASLVVTPDVIEFVGRLTIEGETTANLEEISVNDLPTEYLDKTILDLDLRRKTGCTVIGFKAPDNSYLINPEASIVLQKDSHLIVLGRPEQISKLRALF